MEKITLTRAIHDLKTSFYIQFGREEVITSELEIAINAAAVLVKKGYTAEWYRDEVIKIKFMKPRRWLSKPPYKKNNNYKPSSAGHKNK